MERIELYKVETPKIKISMELYFNDKGQLIFDGYDIGKVVEECWGDSDYEYCYTIEPVDVEKLFSVLNIVNGNRYSLLFELKNRFGNNSGYSDFGEFMTKNNIEYRPSHWA